MTAREYLDKYGATMPSDLGLGVRIDQGAVVGKGEASADQLALGWGRFTTSALGAGAALGFVDEEKAALALSSQAEAERLGKMTQGFKDFMEAEGFGEALGTFLSSPLETTFPLVTQSLGSTLAPAVAGGVAATVATGGNPIAGLVGAGAGGGLGGEGTIGFTSYMQERMVERGMNPENPKDWLAVMRDPQIVEEAANYGLTRGTVIGAVSAVTGGAAGRIAPLFKVPEKIIVRGGQTIVQAPSRLAVAGSRAAGAAGEIAFQSAGEALGEGLAQIASGEGLDFKEMLAEAIGGVGMSTAETTIGMYARRGSALEKIAPATAAQVERINNELNLKTQLTSAQVEQRYMAVFNDLEANALQKTEEDIKSTTELLAKADKFLLDSYTKQINSEGTEFNILPETDPLPILELKKKALQSTLENAELTAEQKAGLEEAVALVDIAIAKKQIKAPTTEEGKTEGETDTTTAEGETQETTSQTETKQGKEAPTRFTGAEEKAQHGTDFENELAADIAEGEGELIFTETEVKRIKENAEKVRQSRKPADTPTAEEGDPVAEALVDIINNTATEEQIVLATAEGLVDFVNGRLVVTDKGGERMTAAGFPRPFLTERERRTQIASQAATKSTPETEPETVTVDSDRPVVELNVDELAISQEVEQFKKGADPVTGVVEPLAGKYQRDPKQPIMVWERTDGTREVISGRHRLDLAKRSDEKTIPAQIWKESDGFTAADMSMLDATANIRDGQGTITDYAKFIRKTNLSREAAEEAGLLSRSKGRSGFEIGKNGSDALFDALTNEQISESKAAAIAQAAPQNEAMQRALIGRDIPIDAIPNWVNLAQSRTETQKADQMDLFGADDSAMQEMDKIAKAASAKVRDLGEDIAAVSGAVKRPARAKKMGVNLKDKKAVENKIAELKALQERYRNIGANPDLVKELLESPVKTEPAKVETLKKDLKKAKDEVAKSKGEKKKAAAKKKAEIIEKIEEVKTDEPSTPAAKPVAKKATPVTKPMEDMSPAELENFLKTAKPNLKNLDPESREFLREQAQIEDAEIFLKDKVGKSAFDKILKQAEAIAPETTEEYTPTAEEAAEFEVESKKKAESKTAQTPAFISKLVEQNLADLGYPKSEINKMSPQQAQEIIQENRTYQRGERVRTESKTEKKEIDALTPEEESKLSETEKKKVKEAVKEMEIPEGKNPYLNAKEKEESSPLTETEKKHLNELVEKGIFGDNPFEAILSAMRDSKNILIRTLARGMQAAVKEGWDPKVKIKVARYGNIKSYGAYNAKSNTVYINLSAISPLGVVDTIAHEVAHSFTLHKMRQALEAAPNSEQGKMLDAFRDLILQTRQYVNLTDHAVDPRTANALGNLDSTKVTDSELIEFVNDILILQDLQTLISEMDSARKADGKTKTKENLLQSVLRRILEFVTGRKVAIDSPLFKAYNDAYNLVIKDNYSKGRMDAASDATSTAESKIIDTLKEKAKQAGKAISEFEIAGVPIWEKQEAYGYNVSGWLGAGRLSIGAFNILSSDSRIKNALIQNVKRISNKLYIESKLSKGKYSEADLKTALADIDNKYTPRQLDAIDAAGRAAFNNTIDAGIRNSGLSKKDIQDIFDSPNRIKAAQQKMNAAEFKALEKLAKKDMQSASDAARLVALKANKDAFALEQANAFSRLPENMQNVVREMREEISNTQLYLAKYAKDKKGAEIIVSSLTDYGNRAYRAAQDPNWEKNIRKDKNVMDAARAAIQESLIDVLTRDALNKATIKGISLTHADARVIASEKVTDAMIDKAVDGFLMIGQEGLESAQGNNRVKIATGIFKTRGFIPAEVQRMMGVYDKADEIFTITMAKLTNTAAKSQVMFELNELGTKEGWVSSEKKPGMMRLPSTPAYGELAGKYVPKKFIEGINAYGKGMDDAPGWLKLFMKATAVSMMTKTVYSPITQVRNYISNYALFAITGNFTNPAEVARSHNESLRLIREKYKMEILGQKISDADAERIRMHKILGIADDQVDTGLMRDLMQKKDYNDPFGINEMLKKIKVPAGVRAVMGTPQFTYSNIDYAFKVMVFDAEVAKAQKNLGMNLQDAQKYAAEVTRNIMPTYSKIPSIIRELKKFPMAAPFVSWTSEVVRTVYNIQKLAINEIRQGQETGNKGLEQQGWQRITSLAATIAIPTATVVAINALMGVDRDEDAAMRRFLPSWQQNSLLVYLGRPKDGKARFIDMSFLLPHNTIIEPFIAAGNALTDPAEEDGHLMNSAIAFIGRSFSPYTSPQILSNAILEATMNKTSSGAQVYNTADSTDQKLFRITTHVAKAFEPGAMVTAGRISAASTGKITSTGRGYDLSNELMSLVFGQRISELDVNQSLRFKAFEYNRQVREARRIFGSSFVNAGTVELSDLENRYNRANEALLRIGKEMYNNMKAAELTGVNSREIMRSLEGAGMNRNDIRDIARGRIPAYTPSANQVKLARQIDTERARLANQLQATSPRVLEFNRD